VPAANGCTIQNRDASYTYGCLEPTAVTQMAKYLDTVYVSGWQSSSTASSTDEPGPDLADYPYVSAFRREEARGSTRTS
jgi:isocitrate lyase